MYAAIQTLLFWMSSLVLLAAPPDSGLMSCDTKPYATIRGSHAFTLSISDKVKVNKVEMYVNSVLKATDNEAPYSFALDGNQYFLPKDAGEVLFVALDSADHEAASLRIPVIFNSELATTSKPTSEATARRRYPELENLSLGFSAQDIFSVDENRLKDGFVILNNAEGKPLYELPMRFEESKTQGSNLSSGFVFVTYYASENSYYLISAYRPTGTVDGTIPLTDLDNQSEESLARLVANLPENFVPDVVKKNVTAKCRNITAKREKGDYLSPSDSLGDFLDLKLYICDTLNSALIASKEVVFNEPFQFERPLVQTRNLVKVVEAGPKSSPTAFISAVRLLNSSGLRKQLYKSRPGNAYENYKVLVVEPWVPVPQNAYWGKSVRGVKVVPFSTQDNLRAIGFSKYPVYKGEVQSNGSLKWGGDGQLVYRP